MTPISKRHRVSFYLYKNQKLRNVCIYIQKARHFAKIKTICVTFLFTKIPTLYVTQFFMVYFKLAFIYIQKAWNSLLPYCYIWMANQWMHLEIVREGIIQNKPRSGGWKKKVDFVATEGVVPRPLVQQKPTLSLQVFARHDFLDCEAFNASLSKSNFCAPP